MDVMWTDRDGGSLVDVMWTDRDRGSLVDVMFVWRRTLTMFVYAITTPPFALHRTRVCPW